VPKKLLDFCCKAGGASMGYHMAGYEVTGVDIEPQPRYPFEFHQDDFTKITRAKARKIAARYDAIAISPPCQGYSVTKSFSGTSKLMLVPEARQLCEWIGLPYIIENVVGAPLLDPVQVCGSGLGMRVRRHRLFESNIALRGVDCEHAWQERHKPYSRLERRQVHATGVISVYGKGDGSYLGDRSEHSQTELWRVAMGIDWMNLPELAEAIPPAYTFFLGRQLANATSMA
jgi:DNA (cytosine-5)-methyltransferase 1